MRPACLALVAALLTTQLLPPVAVSMGGEGERGCWGGRGCWAADAVQAEHGGWRPRRCCAPAADRAGTGASGAGALTPGPAPRAPHRPQEAREASRGGSWAGGLGSACAGRWRGGAAGGACRPLTDTAFWSAPTRCVSATADLARDAVRREFLPCGHPAGRRLAAADGRSPDPVWPHGHTIRWAARAAAAGRSRAPLRMMAARPCAPAARARARPRRSPPPRVRRRRRGDDLRPAQAPAAMLLSPGMPHVLRLR